MTDFTVNKSKITKKILSIINPDSTETELNQAIKGWWVNIRRNSGLGLTPRGKKAFEEAGIQYWDTPIKIQDIMTSVARLRLDQYLPCPYYLLINAKEHKAEPCLRVYDGRVSVMITLHGGILNYINSLDTRIGDLKKYRRLT